NERRKNWPTKARMTEKEVERRYVGEERKRLFASAARANQAAVISNGRKEHKANKTKRYSQPPSETEALQATPAPIKQPPPKLETELERARLNLKAQEDKLAALRKRVTKGQAALDVARTKQAEEDQDQIERLAASLTRVKKAQDTTQDGDESDANSSPLSDSSVLSSDDASEPDDRSDDDDLPEEAPSKPAAPNPTGRPQRLCRYFAASGYCRDGEACIYRHELAPRTPALQQPPPQPPKTAAAPKGTTASEADRKSIYRRLVEQQQGEEDRLALQVIKHLGKAGFFSAEGGGGNGAV
ncbi:hypothetical protein B0A55_12246, partial [Friedmanniomyces simplex]